MPKCFLHVGGLKTGTTSIQRYLRDNRAALFADGLLVPEEGMEPRSGRHRPLLLAMAGSTALPPRILDAPKRLSATLAAHPGLDVLVTCESLEFHFGGEPSPVVRFFAERGYAVELILYVRPQEERIDSNYAQHTRALFGNHEVADFLARFVMSNALMYARWLDVGAAHGVGLTCRPFNGEAFSRGVVRDFLAAVGRDPGGPVAEPRLNESVDPVTLAVARSVMDWLAGRGLALSPRRRALVAERLAEAAAGRADRFRGLTAGQAAHVRRHFRGDNEHFARTVWGRPWGEVFPPGEARARNELDRADASDPRHADYRAMLDAMLPAVEAALADPSLAAQPWVTDAADVDLTGIRRHLVAEDSFPPKPDNLLRV